MPFVADRRIKVGKKAPDRGGLEGEEENTSRYSEGAGGCMSTSDTHRDDGTAHERRSNACRERGCRSTKVKHSTYLSMYRSSGRMYVRVYTVLFSTQGKIDPELEVYKE